MAKPLANDGKLRSLVREVLCMAPGYALEDAQLYAAVMELLPMHSAPESDVLRAAEWNLSRDYVATTDNEDTDNREWRITKDGLAKQSVK